MLKIGDFSTLSRISIHMLRNYDKIELLHPAHVDPETGYRYYSENQLATANRIQALKAMGLGLNTIKDVLNQYNDNKSLSAYLSIQATLKQGEIERLQQQLARIEATIAALGKNGNVLSYSIEVKEIPARIVASIRDKIFSYEKEGDLWLALADTLEFQGIPFASISYDMAIYHDEGFVESGIDIELQKAVSKPGKDTELVRFKQAPSMLAAVLTYEGEYQRISEIGALIANWVKDNNYIFGGPHFNIYHVSPEIENDSGKMVTEVGYPIQKNEIR